MEDLKSIRAAFAAFFEEHALVGTYHFGDLADFVALTDKTFYAVNIEYLNTVPNGKVGSNLYNITVSGRMDSNYPSVEHDVVADCAKIVYDLWAFIGATNTYTSSSVQPFRESDGDFLAGVVASFGITTGLGLNDCIIPKKEL